MFAFRHWGGSEDASNSFLLLAGAAVPVHTAHNVTAHSPADPQPSRFGLAVRR